MRRLLNLLLVLTTLVSTFGILLQPASAGTQENRGYVDVVVDQTLVDPAFGAGMQDITTITYQLQRLANDLAGDGWTVVQHAYQYQGTTKSVLLPFLPFERDPGMNSAGVPLDRGLSVQQLKAALRSDAVTSAYNLKAVILVGHLPQPYAGGTAFDGDPGHAGAWPCDAFYGDISPSNTNDSAWTDSSVNLITANDTRNYNIPGDGKYDNSVLPNDVSVEVGRIDFAGMSGGGADFTKTEPQLIEAYLDKDHAYRNGFSTALPEARIYDVDATAHTAVQTNFNAFFGSTQVELSSLLWPWIGDTADPIPATPPADLQYFKNGDLFYQDMTQGSYQWAEIWANNINNPPSSNYPNLGTFFSSGTNPNNVSTKQFANNDPHALFYFLGGDIFDAGDWQYNDDLLRAAIATKTYGLASVWFDASANWDLTPMATGAEIGQGLLASQKAGAETVVGLMGDPTLRLTMDMPSYGLSVQPDQSTSGAVDLTWYSSYPLDATSKVVGYNVYSSIHPYGPYTKLTPSPIAPCANPYDDPSLFTVSNNVLNKHDTMTYVDTTASTSQPTYYQVRAVFERYTVANAYASPSAPSTTGEFPNLSVGVFAEFVPHQPAPTVAITAPVNFEQANGAGFNLTNGVPFSAPANLTLSATAQASGGATITKVDFYQNATLLGTVSSAQGPWQFVIGTGSNPAVPALQPGTYVFTAVATDSNGLTATSQALRVYVYAPAVADLLAAKTYDITYLNIVKNGALGSGWYDNANGDTGLQISGSGAAIGGLDGKSYSITWPSKTDPPYFLQHAPIDTTVFASSTLEMALATPPGSKAVSVTVSFPLSGPFQKTQTVTVPATATGAIPTPVWVAIPLTDMVGNQTGPSYSANDPGPSPSLQTNFDGIKLQAPSSAQLLVDEVTIGPSYPAAVVRQDRVPTATLTNFGTDVPVTNGTIYWINPSGINLQVDAADPDSTITEVDFFNGNTNPPTNFIGFGTLIPPSAGNESFSTYTIHWNNPLLGTTYLQAQALTGLGNKAKTQVAQVSIGDLYGYVTDQNGNPLSGATLTIKQGATTIDTKTSSASTIAGADAKTTINFNDLAIPDGNGSTVQVSSAAHPFVFSDIGSTLQITGGAGFVQGSYTIVSVDANGVATLSGSAGASSSTGGQGTLTSAGTANYFDGIAPGSYTVTAADGSSYGSVTLPVTISSTNSSRLDIVLPPSTANLPNLTATGQQGKVALSWSAVTGASGYDVYVGTISGGEALLTTGTVAGTSTTVSTLADGSTPLQDGTTYYFIVAPHGGGPATYSNEASATTAPAQPTNLSAIGEIGQVALTWTASPAATSYNIYVSTTSGGEGAVLPITGVTVTNYTVTNLNPGTTYYFEVAGVDSGGPGLMSSEAIATTAPGQVLNLTATGGQNQVTLNWNATTAATSYNVYQSTTSGGEAAPPTVSGVVGTSYTVTGLTAGTTYYFTVTAENAAGIGPMSAEVAMTPAPTGLTAQALQPAAGAGSAQVQLTWPSVAAATSYEIGVGLSTGTEVFSVGNTTTGTTFTVSGLNFDQTYYFEIKAVNSGGTSGVSNEVSATTYPAQPSGLQAAGGQRQVTLSWTGTGPGDTYNIYEGTTAGGEAATPVVTAITGTNQIVSGLSDGVTYYFTVAAVNAVGEVGASSNEASAVTTPPAPTGLTATGGNLQAVLNWTATPGAATYNVYEGTASGKENPTPIESLVSGTTYTVTGLSFGSTYYFTVKAVNTAGTSPASNEASTTATPAPPAISVVGGFEKATLTWSVTAGATSYNVYDGTTSGGEAATPVTTVAPAVGATSVSVDVTGLSDGTTYYFTVASVNAGGPSGPSNEVSALTSPAIPTGITATPAINQVTLKWTASPTATSYNIYEGTSATGISSTPIKANYTGTTFVVVVPSPSTAPLYFTISAANATGSSPQSAPVSTTPLAPIPSAPTNVQAFAGNGQAVISWTAPANATSYNVFASTTSGTEAAPAVATSTSTSATVTGLTNGTRYYFTVVAVDSGGTSPMSAEATTVPVAPVTFSAGWHLFSVPLDYSTVSIDTALGTTGSVVYTWMPQAFQYAVSPNAPADHLRLGVGYWCKFAQPITTGVGGIPADPTQDFTINLQQGWNMIGDPFLTAIPLSSTKFAGGTKTFAQASTGTGALISGTVWGYDHSANNGLGGYVQATSLSEGNGYWLYAYQATTMTVPHP